MHLERHHGEEPPNFTGDGPTSCKYGGSHGQKMLQLWAFGLNKYKWVYNDIYIYNQLVTMIYHLSYNDISP